MKKKICLLGMYGVGKTSLVRRFVYNKFEERYLSTLGVNITKKALKISNPKNDFESIELIIWDIANIEKFDKITKNYLRGAHGAIIVTDVSRPNTFDPVNNFLEDFLQINKNAKYIIVGNKVDLLDSVESEISKIRLNFESDTQLLFASAKTGENINDIFINLCTQLIEESHL